jgi:hypothetical protein
VCAVRVVMNRWYRSSKPAHRIMTIFINILISF